MQVSDKEIKRILSTRVEDEIDALMEGIDDPSYEIDPEMVKAVAQAVIEMPDREDRVAELKAKIESGEYNPTTEQIVDAMIRRSIADSVR
jgi:anti-sigma28 factor (negative regulator of flagellin synthesis)